MSDRRQNHVGNSSTDPPGYEGDQSSLSDELLPLYSAGSSDESNSGRTLDGVLDADHELSIILDQRPYHTARPGSTITGTATFSPNKELLSPKVIISLVQIEEVRCVNATGRSHSRVRRSIVLQEDHVAFRTLPEDFLFRPGSQYAWSFNFEMPTSMPDNRTGVALHSIPPPSFGYASKEVAKRKKKDYDVIGDASVRIMYGVRICLYSQELSRVPVRRAYRFFKFAPENILPQLLEHKVHSTILLQSTGYVYEGEVLKKSSLLSSQQPVLARIFMDLEGPPLAFLLKSIADSSFEFEYEPVNTSLELRVTLSMETNAPDIRPLGLKALRVRLNAHTLSSYAFINHIPAPYCGGRVHTCTDVLSDRKLEYPNASWSLMDDSRTFVTLLTVPLSFDLDNRYIPTYYASLSSRQYELVISLDFEKCAPVEMTLPLIFHTS